jgi:citrate synthase
MEYIKNKFFQVATKQAADYINLRNNHSDVLLAKVTIGDVMSGMKGIPSLITDTSKLDPQEGIRYRGL